jgi:hypothetical protein
MINLIEPEVKRQLRAGKLNTILLNYCLMLSVVAALTALMFGAGFWLTLRERATADEQRTRGEQASTAYATTKQAATDFKNDLKQAQTILGSQVSMYDLLTRITGLVPPGVILSNLALGTASLNTPLAISAKAQSYNAAVLLKNNLAGSNVFSAVSIVNTATSIVDSKQDPVGASYPVVVNISAQFSDQFVKAAASGAKP